MSAARLSPAASLLRNSRLFAIPAPLSLPSTEPSSEPVARSDTATTPYPLQAALETPTTSLNRGDWGLKRPLPIRTTTKSGTPVIRIQRGIDTAEHIADFESAADHALTLRKYQELNLRVVLPAPKDRRTANTTQVSAFDSDVDHTADGAPPALQNASKSWLDMDASEWAAQMPRHLRDTIEELAKTKAGEPELQISDPPSQQAPSKPLTPLQSTRRWRYTGPYLAGLNGMEFDSFLNKISREKKAAFRAVVKEHLINQRQYEQRLEAIEQGTSDTLKPAPTDATEEEVTEHIRYLRSEPGKFGPLIAEFFDLADGPKPPSQTADPWSYGRDTISADLYKESGPPRTHPSAGLTYAKSDTLVHNDAFIGPRASRAPVPARLLKSIQTSHNRHIPFVGVAGFVVPQPVTTTTSFQEYNWKWAPTKDGPKMVVTPTTATVSQAGKLEIETRLQPDWRLEGDVPVNSLDKIAKRDGRSPRKANSLQLPKLDNLPRQRRPKTRTPITEDQQDISDFLEKNMSGFSNTKSVKLS